MKKIFAIILLMVLICSFFAGCLDEKKTIVENSIINDSENTANKEQIEVELNSYSGQWIKTSDYLSVNRELCEIIELKHNNIAVKDINTPIEITSGDKASFAGNDFLKGKKVTVNLRPANSIELSQAELENESRYVVIYLDEKARGTFDISDDISKNVIMECGIFVDNTSPNGTEGLASIKGGSFLVIAK